MCVCVCVWGGGGEGVEVCVCVCVVTGMTWSRVKARSSHIFEADVLPQDQQSGVSREHRDSLLLEFRPGKGSAQLGQTGSGERAAGVCPL